MSVSQKLDAALKSPVAVAEGPEHGGGVRAPGHGVSWWGRGAGAPRTRAPSLVAVRGEGASFTVGDPYTRDLPDPRAGQSRDGADCDRSRSAGVVQRDTVTKMARRRYWLMKCEPAAYTIDDLGRDGRTSWEGVRNFQARNFIRDDMKMGDGVLFYASNADPSGVTGLAEISKTGYPDHYAWKKGHNYFDARSTRASPVWYMVDVSFVERFPATLSLATLKMTRGLGQMKVTQKGSRLSIQPVTQAEYDIVVRLGRRAARSTKRERASLESEGVVRESGASDHDVRDFLGHANITTTSRYLASTPLRLEQALANLEFCSGSGPSQRTAAGSSSERMRQVGSRTPPGVTRTTARMERPDRRQCGHRNLSPQF